MLGLSRFRDYLDELEAGGPQEWEEFINALTTNITSFYREAHHFPVLADLLRRVACERRVTLWCSACSTGEEPYSMAMTALDAPGPGAPVRIPATDIDTSVLAQAEKGVYPAERIESLPAGYAKKFFLRGGGAHEGKVKVRTEVRQMITFRQLNLLGGKWPIGGPLDAIFCRNVMIYFDRATQKRILEKFAPLLHPNALLFMGHSESLHHAADLFELRGKTVYQPAAKQCGASRG